jgi:hypothetical protein
MSKRAKKLVLVCLAGWFTVLAGGTAGANWSETFGGNAFDLPTWQFHCYPDLTKTFGGTIQDGAGDDDYLALAETSSVGVYGSAFGIALGSAEEFTDVRVGALVNIAGDARDYHGLGARATYIIDDSSISGAPGILASSYIMLVHWQDGPAYLRIEVFKVFNLDDGIMKTFHEEPVPGIGHGRSYYAELDVVGSDPVYITGSLYEYKGGPLLARTPTLVDTAAEDPWENAGPHTPVYPKGASAIFGLNKNPEPAGYRCTFDSVSSVSDGPAAVLLGPADGATDVSVDADLTWVEADFTTSRELWFGKVGAMEKVSPAPPPNTYEPGTLDWGQTYQWRVDEVGPGGVVSSRVATFTTKACGTVDDFESYANDAAIEAAWPHNIPPEPTGPLHYVFLETGQAYEGGKAMRLEYQNQYEPYFTEATRTFAVPVSWDVSNLAALSLFFRGRKANVPGQPIYVRLADAAANTFTVTHPYDYAVEADSWNEWRIDLKQFSDAGLNLSLVKKLTVGVGDGANSGQVPGERDQIIIDSIRICPARCFNSAGLDLRGDVNGDCRVDFRDFAAVADGWLNDGLSAAP